MAKTGKRETGGTWNDDLSRHLAELGKYLKSISLAGVVPGGEADIYRRVIEAFNDAVYIESVDGRIIDVNRAACEMLGYARKEFLSMDVAGIVSPEVASRFKGFIREETLREGVYIETEELRKDGTLIPVEVSCTLVTIDGEPRVLAVVRNITRRKVAERKLRESEHRYRSLFDGSPISLWEEDLSGVKKRVEEIRAWGVGDFREYFSRHPEEASRCASLVKIIDVNKATLDFFDAGGVEDFRGDLRTLFSKETKESFREELVAVSEQKKSFRMKSAAKTLKGDRRDVIVHWTVMPGSEETYARVLVSIVDISSPER